MRGMDILAGQLRALAEANIRPGAICGTSAGAGIAALVAAGYTAASTASIIAGLRDKDVRSERWFWKPRALWIDHFLESGPIRRILHQHLPGQIEELRIPYACATTRVTDGAEIVWSTHPDIIPGRPLAGLPDWREAVLASMSISGVFPWVCIDPAEPVQYADGGVRANLPLPANWPTFDSVYLLIASYTNDYAPAGASILSRLLLNASWYAQDQIEDVLARVHRAAAKKLTVPPVKILWPPPRAKGAGLLRFDHTLIPAAHRTAQKTLDRI